jgi:hypothetical protein
MAVCLNAAAQFLGKLYKIDEQYKWKHAFKIVLTRFKWGLILLTSLKQIGHGGRRFLVLAARFSSLLPLSLSASGKYLEQNVRGEKDTFELHINYQFVKRCRNFIQYYPWENCILNSHVELYMVFIIELYLVRTWIAFWTWIHRL